MGSSCVVSGTGVERAAEEGSGQAPENLSLRPNPGLTFQPALVQPAPDPEMKKILLLLILLGIGVWLYLQFHGGDAPAAQEPHLARAGTFFVLQYVSVPSAHGIIGFEPGREVHFVRSDRQKGMLLVSDGEYEVEMKPSQLTNDLDIAALARKGDNDSQEQIRAYIEHEKVVYAAITRAADLRYSQEMERVNHAGSGAGAASPSGPPPGVGANNPYSYLAPQH
jgi:hypothetical protein